MSENVDNGMTAYVRYRLEKAQEVYEAACVLYNAAQWNSVINRLSVLCNLTCTLMH